jgi:hypothetical protein
MRTVSLAVLCCVVTNCDACKTVTSNSTPLTSLPVLIRTTRYNHTVTIIHHTALQYQAQCYLSYGRPCGNTAPCRDTCTGRARYSCHGRIFGPSSRAARRSP